MVISPLKWAGGKGYLIPQLSELYAPYRGRRLVEPFVGSMKVAMGLQPRSALLGDVNPHLMNFLKWLRMGLPYNYDLARACELKIDMRNERECYLKARQRFNELISCKRYETQEGALLFWYLNRTCFNGLCRFNRKGQFNVGFGQYKTIDYAAMMGGFAFYPEVMKSWRLTCSDFAQLAVYPNDFIYADPPYDVQFTTYTPGGFSWADQVRLAEWLAGHPGPVVASNSATDRVIGLYKRLGFEIRIVRAPRNISCTGERAAVDEMLAVRM